MNQQILKDIGGTLSFKYYENSIQKKPSAAKITIYDEDGAEKVAETNATIAGDGTISYNIASAICDDIYYNWKALWKLTVTAGTIYRSSLFDIVMSTVYNPVIDDDIINRAPFVKEMNYRKIGTAILSSSKSLLISNDLTEDDDYWTGGSVEITEGTCVGEKRKVTAFANKTLTPDQDFSAALDATSQFVVIRSFNKELTEAFNKLKEDLFTKGIKINQIIDSEQLREYIIILTLHFICANFTKSPVDIWFEKANKYEEEYNKMLGRAVFDMDTDDDGDVDEGQQSIGQVKGAR